MNLAFSANKHNGMIYSPRRFGYYLRHHQVPVAEQLWRLNDSIESIIFKIYIKRPSYHYSSNIIVCSVSIVKNILPQL